MTELELLQLERELFAALADPEGGRDPRDLLELALTLASERTGAAMAYIGVFAAGVSGSPLEPLWDVARGCDAGGEEHYRAHFSQTILSRALDPDRGARPLHVGDAMGVFPPGHSVARKQIASVVAAPFGRVARGVLLVQSRRLAGERFDDEDRVYVERLSRMLAPAVDALARQLAPHADERIWHRFDRLIGRSPAAVTLRGAGAEAAQRSVHVWVSGPAGSGRKLLAEVIHEASRGGRPCATVRATKDFSAPAFVADMNGGTVIVSGVLEAGAPPLDVVLGRLSRVDPTALRVVLIAPTGASPMGGPPDLVRLDVPRLADRLLDVVPLLEHFGKRAAEQRGLAWRGLDEAVRLSAEVIAADREVGDLEDAIEQAMVDDPARPLDVASLQAHRPGAVVEAAPTAVASVSSGFVLGSWKGEILPAFEKAYLQWALAQCDYNVRATAVALDVGPANLWEKIKRFGLVLPLRRDRVRSDAD